MNPNLQYNNEEKILSNFITGRMVISNLKHQDLSNETGVDLDKVKLIQAGAVPIDDRDFQTILEFFNITPNKAEEIIKKNQLNKEVSIYLI